jgi:hypothetical protein
VLINSSDPDWFDSALRIIEFLSSIWGGKHSIIVPTDGLTIDLAFWKILEQFSPDYVYFYRKTGADFKLAHPEEYSAELLRAVEQYQAGLPTIDEHEKDIIDRDLQRSWADNFDLGSDLRTQIADRLVPFHFEKNFHPIGGGGHVPNDLTSIENVLPYLDHPPSFTSLHPPAEVGMIWSAIHTGAYPRSVSERLLAQSMSETLVHVTTDNLRRFIDWIAGGALNVASQQVSEGSGPEFAFMPPGTSSPTPFEISMLGVGLYGSPSSSREFADHFCLVIGDSISDFCFSYCLPRIGRRAVWLPSLWIDALQSKRGSILGSCVFPVVYSIPMDVRMKTGLDVCSPSKGTAYVSEVLGILRKYTSFGANSEKTRPTEPIQIVTQPGAGLIPYCIDSPNHTEIYPFLGDKSVGAMRSPRPNHFSKLKADKHRWVAELSFRSRAVPTIPHIAENLVFSPGRSGTHDFRVSPEALAYVCPGSLLIIGDDINANLQNPEIRLFDTFSAISFIAAASGYECQLSDKGTYQRDSIEKFGGISKASDLLKASDSRAVFKKFLDHTKREENIYDEGCVLQGRTYLDFSATEKAMCGDQNAAVTLLDRLTAAKVTCRGFVLGCSVCKHAAWYALADLTDDFHCTRCTRRQAISYRNWKHPASPQIFYKLDEIVYLFLKNDGDIVALSLDYMARKSKHPFSYCPEIELTADDKTPKGEIDFCAVYDGLLTIGEAKKQGELASSVAEARKVIEKYLRLANLLKARRVLFCTTAPAWKNSTVEAIQEAFQDNLAAPMFLSAKELLGNQ